MSMTAPGRLAAAPREGTGPDRQTRIGSGPLRMAPRPLAACGGLSPTGPARRFVRGGPHPARWSN